MSLPDLLKAAIHGPASRPTLLLVHGYGCDQSLWRHLVPLLAPEFRTATFDLACSGGADPEAYDPVRHATLDGYADDVVALCSELGLDEVVVVGHSIASMIGVRAHLRAPDLVAGLVMLAPSPRFIDDSQYVGGFSREQVDGLLADIAASYEQWATAMGPVFMGRSDSPELAAELTATFLRMDPDVATELARVVFLSDSRVQLPAVQCPALVVQVPHDPLVPPEVGRYLRDNLPDCTYAEVGTDGHFPHVSAPEETAAAILTFVRPIESFLHRTRR